jgi:DNA polymerase I-like protein with 3'-5' exonuclease and polymerase domains
MELIFDIETDGFIRSMTRIHTIVARDVRDVMNTDTFVFRHHDGYERVCLSDGREVGPLVLRQLLEQDPALEHGPGGWVEPENNICDGVELLFNADALIGHNIIHFDIKAIQKLYPDFIPYGLIRDTLPLCRLLFPEIKKRDFGYNKAGKLPSNLIGSHSLDAWGWRLGKHKGDYSKEMTRFGLNPWGSWNIDMEEYCVNDVDVNQVLWAGLRVNMPTQTAVELEQQSHEIGGMITANGFPFDKAGAEKLVDELTVRLNELTADLKDKIGYWYRPKKKKIVRAPYCEETQIERKKAYETPDFAWGEDYDRAVWGAFQFPKKNRKSLKLGDLTVGCPYCPIERVEFNPGSRHHIIDRFTTQYDWVPVDFTETGTPEVNDVVLKKMAESIPMARPLADIFFYRKLLGQIAEGGNSWLKKFDEETGAIHHYLNVGGTVSGRCSHNSPNLGQVPAVTVEKVLEKDGSFNRAVIDDAGIPFPECFDAEGKPKKKAILLGKNGAYGYECRSLFFTPSEIMQVLVDEAGSAFEEWHSWLQVGTDLSGIEFRMLAEACAEYDKGELIEVVLSGDIHAYNMEKTGITNRDIIKRGLYALLYGAGDYKIGITIQPLASFSEAMRIGKDFRATLMAGLPALRAVIQATQRQAETGYLVGIDGRRLRVRNTYSALNLRLQSAAGLLAKKWLCLTYDKCVSRGWYQDWNGDFALLAFVHDEIQAAVKREYAEEFSEICISAAAEAGKFFNMTCPVGAESKFGQNWAECH